MRKPIRRASRPSRCSRSFPPGRELAIAYGVSSSICMNREDAEGTMRWGTRATELAERLDEAEALAYSLNNVGTMKLLAETPQE